MADTTKELIKKELYFLALYNTGIIKDVENFIEVDTTKSSELYTYITREINNIRQKIKVFNKNIIIRFTHILLNELIDTATLGENKEILETIKKNNIKNYYNNILNFFTALYYKDYSETTKDTKKDIKQNIRILIELYKVLIKNEENNDNYKDEINTLILNQQLYHSLFDEYNQKINNKYEILKQEMNDLTTINKINYLNHLCYL